MRRIALSICTVSWALAPVPFELASADSLVKTRAQCTRFAGAIERNSEKSTRKAYPWVCKTPKRDRQCEKRHGEAYYFDAETGKCEEDWEADWMRCELLGDC